VKAGWGVVFGEARVDYSGKGRVTALSLVRKGRERPAPDPARCAILREYLQGSEWRGVFIGI